MSEEKRRCVRRRNRNPGSESRIIKLSLRMTQATSNRLASIQGLVRAFGKRESLAELFERVAMPALAEYVRPYADRAGEARLAEARAQT